MDLNQIRLMMLDLKVKERWQLLDFLMSEGLIEAREYSNEEIAYLMGVSPAAISKIYKSAIKKLQSMDLDYLHY